MASLGFNPLAFVVEQVAEDDFRAFLGEQYRLGSSLSARAAAYEGYLAVQPSHGEPPRVVSGQLSDLTNRMDRMDRISPPLWIP